MALLPVGAAFPVSKVYDERLTALVDKKLSGGRLTASENWKHLSYLAVNADYSSLYNQKKERIFTLVDGIVKVYDATRGKIAGQIPCTAPHCDCVGSNITLNRIAVQGPSFAREYHTEYLIVRDAEAGCVEIFEQETQREALDNPLQNPFHINLLNRVLAAVSLFCNEHQEKHVCYSLVYSPAMPAAMLAANALQEQAQANALANNGEG